MYTKTIAGANEVLLNSIRSAMLLHVPALAIHYVEFLENSTTFPDGFLAHRFGMVAVKAASLEAVKSLNTAEACSCDGKRCSKCSIRAYVHVVNSQENGLVPVRWADIKIEGKMASILFPEQTLVMLAAGKELKCRLWIMRGSHEQHSKWAVATAVAVQAPVIKFEAVGILSAPDVYRGALEALVHRLRLLLD